MIHCLHARTHTRPQSVSRLCPISLVPLVQAPPLAPPQAPPPQPRQPAVPLEDALRAAAAAAAARKAAKPEDMPRLAQPAAVAAVPDEPSSERGPAAWHGSRANYPDPAVMPDDKAQGQMPAAEVEHAAEPPLVSGEMDKLTAEGIAAAEVLVAAAREVSGPQVTASFPVPQGWHVAQKLEHGFFCLALWMCCSMCCLKCER